VCGPSCLPPWAAASVRHRTSHKNPILAQQGNHAQHALRQTPARTSWRLPLALTDSREELAHQ
jgi:hypothetical protein